MRISLDLKYALKKILRFLHLEGPVKSPYTFFKALFFRKEPDQQKKLYDLCCTWLGLPQQLVVPGHFYSPLPSSTDIDTLLKTMPEPCKVIEVQGIDISLEKHLALWDEFLPYLRQMSFSVESRNDGRYHFSNGSFEQGDGTILYAMLHYFKPKKMIEIGCGYSTSLSLDVITEELSGKTSVTLIDPFPGLALSLLEEKRIKGEITLHAARIQDVPLDIFQTLESGDILFIDSTHVAKAGSDVLHEYFSILPCLQAGVVIHIHDIFWPFEYLPHSFTKNFPAWNELYLLRALLTNNPHYEILFFNHYFGLMAESHIAQSFPLFLENTGGSLWLRKL